jgi:ubiquinone biosynthesis protein Coq4
MLQRWEASGVLFVSIESISHPFLTDVENALFRAVHDWHHILMDADSTLNGEIATFKHACTTAPREIWWMLRSEIVLQAAACIATGEFQPQKLVR